MIKFHTDNVSVTEVYNSVMTTQNNLATTILKVPGQIFNLLLLWQERAATRAGLLDLDARFLADVGLSAKQANTEARKPFWIG